MRTRNRLKQRFCLFLIDTIAFVLFMHINYTNKICLSYDTRRVSAINVIENIRKTEYIKIDLKMRKCKLGKKYYSVC